MKCTTHEPGATFYIQPVTPSEQERRLRKADLSHSFPLPFVLNTLFFQLHYLSVPQMSFKCS
jgi:hypothetical protein